MSADGTSFWGDLFYCTVTIHNNCRSSHNTFLSRIFHDTLGTVSTNSVDRTPVIGRLAWVVLVVNIVLPGFGTFFCAAVAKEHQGRHAVYGLLQLLTTPLFLIGWFWAIFYGIHVCIHRNKEGDYYPVPLPTMHPIAERVDPRPEPVVPQQSAPDFHHMGKGRTLA
ncbi:SPEC3/Stum family protein [Kipferlia bialata]|uniref:SPEC3/Stum family protein n=1 Tax=Kipferlia bialata TaxID=797122 RepID=A0A9K3CZQ2_9EUKA|nr:SPEC3/Stum family protein [Kipferlia bialata]|eukprot:g7021.t1